MDIEDYSDLYSFAVKPEDAHKYEGGKGVGILVYTTKAEYTHPLDRYKQDKE